jgi:glycosyltransferase involved in cell wall biosynthesis
MISVIIPNYNGVNVVQRAIDSVIAQEIADIEIIVVDDCSTDASCDVVRSYGAKVRLIALPHNLRVNGARNAGLDACRHDCVMFLDNDDYLLPRTLAAWRQDLEESGADVVIGPMLYEFNGHLTRCERAAMPPYGLRSGLETAEAWLDSWVAPCCVLWKRYMVERSGKWYLPAGRSRDTDGELVWRAALHNARFYWSEKGTGVYVQHDSAERVSLQRDGMAYDSHFDWISNLVSLALRKDPRFNEVFAKLAYSLARECYAQSFVEQGRKFEMLYRSISDRDVLAGTVPHKIFTKLLGLRRKETLSRFVRLGRNGSRKRVHDRL